MTAVEAAITLFLAATTLAALLALYAGVRGRRLDEHPLCRRCGFDLVGVYPRTPTCPECGRDVVETGVRIGHRRSRWGLVAAGALWLLLLTGLLGGAAVINSKGYNWNKIKPDWLLAMETMRTDPSAATAANELVGRVNLGRTDTNLDRRVAAWILNRQEDPASMWLPEWGNLIEAARIRESLATDDWERYVRTGLAATSAFAAKDDGAVLITLQLGPTKVGSAQYVPAWKATLLEVSAEGGRLSDEWKGTDHAFVQVQGGSMVRVTVQSRQVLSSSGAIRVHTRWRFEGVPKNNSPPVVWEQTLDGELHVSPR